MILSRDHESDGLIATISRDGVTEKYALQILACDNPVCTCGTLSIDLKPLAVGNGNLHQPVPRQIAVDVYKKKLDPKRKSDLNFAKLFIKQLDDEDFILLSKMHYAYKNDRSEKAAPDSIDAVFNYQDIEEGITLSYRDVLPYGDPLLCTWKGMDCVILDQFCLRTKCRCKDAFLTLVSVDSEGKKKEIGTVVVNYRSHEWSTLDKCPPEELCLGEVKTAIVDDNPDIYSKLFKRHMKLRAIYAHCKKRHHAKETKQPEPRPQKVGRNDPCPCGSGKKYKKCCGAS